MGNCKGCGQAKKAPRKLPVDSPGDGAAETLTPLKQVEPSITPPADKLLQAMRVQVCGQCREQVLDEDGKPTDQRLYGQWDSRKYCGNPSDPNTALDPERYGCGCAVVDRAAIEDATCPRKHWGPGPNFYDTVIPLPAPGKATTLPGVIDFIGPTLTPEGVSDCSGIGDVMVQGVVAQAIARHNEKRGLRVRFLTVESRVDWAKMVCPGIEVRATNDPERVPGEFTRHSAPLRLIEIDATCLMMKQNRHQLWVQQFGVPVEEVEQWDMPLDEAKLKEAEDYLSVPLKAGAPIVAVSPFANSLTRQWPLRQWVEVIDKLKKLKVAVFVVAHPKHSERLGRSQKFPTRQFLSTDPQLVAAVISKCSLVVGSDSGMCHIAGALRRPALALCAPTDGATAFGGWPTVRYIQAEKDVKDSCTACLWYKDRGWKPWCGFGCGLLADIKPATVLPRIEEILRETGALK